MNDPGVKQVSELDELTHALERRPAVSVPRDFAARVCAVLPSRPRAEWSGRDWNVGERLTWFAVCALCLCCFRVAALAGAASVLTRTVCDVAFAQLLALCLVLILCTRQGKLGR